MKSKLFIIISLALVSLFTFSCSSDDDKDTIGSTDKLVGTSWKSEIYGTEYDVIVFTSDSEIDQVFYKKNNSTGKWDQNGDADSGTYNLNGKNITIHIDGYSVKGVINGNKITFKDEVEGETSIYTKM